MYGREMLRRTLARIDGRPYSAYRDLTGAYAFGRFTLHIEHVQPDPYAPPSRLRLVMPAGEVAFTAPLCRPAARRIALEDWLLRRFYRQLAKAAGRDERMDGEDGEVEATEADGKDGERGLPASCLQVMRPGQEVMERSAISLRGGQIEVRLACDLPARGRLVLGARAAAALDIALPAALIAMLPQGPADEAALDRHVALYEDQEALRALLQARGWVAFLADGSILPRESGWSNRPLPVPRAVPLVAPERLAVRVHLPHRGEVRGLPIPGGVTLIVGGAYHGKSTLLRALEHGIYNHVAGDGRELCVTRATASTVAAEDGRPVTGVDIAGLVRPLPGMAGDTRRFSTRAASGSTAQASAVSEALEAGSDCLLIDEDRSAANFMSRDSRMRTLVPDAEDPVIPFVDRVRAIWQEAQAAVVLVVGGAGAFLDAADLVIRMRDYQPLDVTALAADVCQRIPQPPPMPHGPWRQPTDRVPLPGVLGAGAAARIRARPRGPRAIACGDAVIDLAAQSQLVDAGQVRALADMLPKAAAYADGTRTLTQVVAEAFADVERLGLAAVSPWAGQCPGDYAMPRPLDLVAALNRLPGLGLVGEPAVQGGKVRRDALQNAPRRAAWRGEAGQRDSGRPAGGWVRSSERPERQRARGGPGDPEASDRRSREPGTDGAHRGPRPEKGAARAAERPTRDRWGRPARDTGQGRSAPERGSSTAGWRSGQGAGRRERPADQEPRRAASPRPDARDLAPGATAPGSRDRTRGHGADGGHVAQRTDGPPPAVGACPAASASRPFEGPRPDGRAPRPTGAPRLGMPRRGDRPAAGIGRPTPDESAVWEPRADRHTGPSQAAKDARPAGLGAVSRYGATRGKVLRPASAMMRTLTPRRTVSPVVGAGAHGTGREAVPPAARPGTTAATGRPDRAVGTAHEAARPGRAGRPAGSSPR